MGWTMGMAVPLFLAIWITMMVAMMFPTAAPMILTFARVNANKRTQGQPYVPTWVFVAGYLAVWSVAGLGAFGLAAGVDQLADRWMWLMDNANRIGGGLLVVAGIYQLTPLKRVCLSNCRSPMSFILTSWRDGYGGSFRMGISHGVYCLGCCWLLFLILLPLGMMNVAAMAAITTLIFLEKATPIGQWAARVAAATMIGYGLVVIFKPDTLPSSMS